MCKLLGTSEVLAPFFSYRCTSHRKYQRLRVLCNNKRNRHKWYYRDYMQLRGQGSSKTKKRWKIVQGTNSQKKTNTLFFMRIQFNREKKNKLFVARKELRFDLLSKPINVEIAFIRTISRSRLQNPPGTLNWCETYRAIKSVRWMAANKLETSKSRKKNRINLPTNCTLERFTEHENKLRNRNFILDHYRN